MTRRLSLDGCMTAYERCRELAPDFEILVLVRSEGPSLVAWSGTSASGPRGAALALTGHAHKDLLTIHDLVLHAGHVLTHPPEIARAVPLSWPPTRDKWK